MRVLLAIVLGLFLVLPAVSEAVTYYVDNVLPGSDSNNGTAEATPFLTIQKGHNVAVAGDLILVKDGTYTTASTAQMVLLSRSGTVSAPITFRSFNRLGAKLNGQSNTTAWAFDMTTASNLVIQDFEIYGFQNGIQANIGSNLSIIGNLIHDIGRKCTSSDFGLSGVFTRPTYSNITITGNVFHTLGRYQPGENGCTNTNTNYQNHDHGLYMESNTAVITNNIFYNLKAGWPVHIYFATVSGYTIAHNVFAEPNTWRNGYVLLYTTLSNVDISNNIFYAPTGACSVDYSTHTMTNVTVRNNITYTGVAGCATKAGVTVSGSLNNTNPLFTNAGSRDFTITSTSPALNAGASSTLPYNGSAPTIGAYDPPRFATCVVEDGAASTLRITYTNNAQPPLLPATGMTTYTARKATVNNVVTAAIRTGDNRVDLTLTNAIVAAEAVDFSWASGNVTDSSLIGGAPNQPILAATLQSCTNNVGAAASYVFTQDKFRFYYVRGTEAAPVSIPPGTTNENKSIFMSSGGKVRLRLSVTCTIANCPPAGFFLRYSLNGGGYQSSNVVPNVFAGDKIAFCGTSPDADIPLSGTLTTNQLTTGGAYIAGALVRTSNAIPTVDLALNGKTEVEYCLAFSTATINDTYDFRIYQQDGTVLVYTNTPRVTMIGSQGGLGF